MRTFNIAVTIDGRVTDVIQYKAERRTPERESELVTKLIDCQVCDIKAIEVINTRKIIITSKKGTDYTVTWASVTM